MKNIFTFVLGALGFLIQPELLLAQQPATANQDIAKFTEMLPGSWEWIESRFVSRGVQPTLKTPETEKKTVTINFRPDNLVSVNINKKYVGMFQYVLTQPTNDYVLIRFKANEGQPLPEFLQEGPLTIADNELYIAGGYNDAGLNVKFRKTGTKPTIVKKPATPEKKATPAKKPAPKKKPATAPKTQK